MSSQLVGRGAPAGLRAGVSAAVGAVAAVVVGVLAGWVYAPAAGWSVAGLLFVGWTWLAIGRMTPEQTRAHATREDPTRSATDVMVLLASIASLAGLAYLLVAGSAHGAAADLGAALGIASVSSAWLVVHTVFSLRYASLYYGGSSVGGIDFDRTGGPAYLEFAYLGFTIGMTYQVSDTALQSRAVRATALRHALYSYLLGAVVLAVTINLVAGLGSSG